MKVIDKLFDKFGRNNPEKKAQAKQDAQQAIANAAMQLNLLMGVGDIITLRIGDGKMVRDGKTITVPESVIAITKNIAMEHLTVMPNAPKAESAKK